jgi:hypothetical protein
MSDIVESLILDLLEWVANGERSYDQVMDAWRTSCPRLPVWEDANDRGLVIKEQVNGHLYVRITSSGLALLEQRKLLQGLNH